LKSFVRNRSRPFIGETLAGARVTIAARHLQAVNAAQQWKNMGDDLENPRTSALEGFEDEPFEATHVGMTK
jgi:hypothetical protein